jgi:peroxiredoxin
LLVIILGIVAALTVKRAKNNSSAENIADKVVTVNQPLPEINFVDYKDKANYNQELKQGRVLLIYIMTSCGGCQMEADIIAQSNLAKDSRIRIFAIANEDSNSLAGFSKNHSFEFSIFSDENDVFRKGLNITHFPTNFLINNGIIEKRWVGSPRNAEELYKKLEIPEMK